MSTSDSAAPVIETDESSGSAERDTTGDASERDLKKIWSLAVLHMAQYFP